MVRILIEMWPHGDESKRRTLGEGFIANIGGTQGQGHYEVRLMKSPEYAKSAGIWKRGKVVNFDRLRLGPWDLLLQALLSAIGKRNPIDIPLADGESNAATL